MADSITGFAITGIAEVDRALRLFEPKLRKKIERSAIRKAAKPVLASAKAKAPAGPTGDLIKSLKIRALPRSRSRATRGTVGVRIVTSDVFFQGKQFYAGFVEFGAPGHKHYGRGAAPLQPKPFLRPAADENEDVVKGIFRAEVRKAVEAVAKELNKPGGGSDAAVAAAARGGPAKRDAATGRFV